MSDISTTRIFTDGERGITAQKLNDIVGSSTIQPAFYTSKPTAPSADPADIALILKAGAYAQIPISSLAGSATQAQIWDTRLRSYNAIGNPNFEVDQRQCGALFADTGYGTPKNVIDRWIQQESGTGLDVTTQQISGNVVVPGTNFLITKNIFRINLTGQQTTLGANDYLMLYQNVEGPQLRELLGDVHSLSLLVRSSVANLKFGLALQDGAGSYTLAKLCTIPSPGVWTLITLPNLPTWTPSGTFPLAAGSVGYYLYFSLAAGSSRIISANDVWLATSSIGAVGQFNFCANPVNSTFDIAFVQHEPGPLCTTLMDKPFSQNLDECQRYYAKSLDYALLPGTAASVNGCPTFMVLPNATFWAAGNSSYKQRLAKVVAPLIYSPTSGLINEASVYGAGDVTVNGVGNYGDTGFSLISFSAAQTAGWAIQAHWTADTGM